MSTILQSSLPCLIPFTGIIMSIGTLSERTTNATFNIKKKKKKKTIIVICTYIYTYAVYM